MSKEIKSLADCQPDSINANEGTVRGMAQLEHSMERLGAGRSIVVDRNGKQIAGNKSAEVWGQVASPDDIIVVESDGTKLVVVQRLDLDLDDEKDLRARELAIADNRVGENNLKWNPAALLALSEVGVKVDHYFVPAEMERLREELQERAEADQSPLDPQTPLKVGAVVAAPPEAFQSFTPETVELPHQCPKCGFRY